MVHASDEHHENGDDFDIDELPVEDAQIVDPLAETVEEHAFIEALTEGKLPQQREWDALIGTISEERQRELIDALRGEGRFTEVQATQIYEQSQVKDVLFRGPIRVILEMVPTNEKERITHEILVRRRIKKAKR